MRIETLAIEILWYNLTSSSKIGDNKKRSKGKKWKKQRNRITAARLVRNKLIPRSLRDNLNDQQKRFNVINQERDSSNWVSTLSNSDEEYMMTKQLFWDLIKIWYRWALYCLADKCVWVEKFNLHHVLSSKNGGFVSISDITKYVI